ncbi:conserved membrane hypothetical protein [groundwater metagenome]|uniref:Uncharacterized protein n=1 Tax=groundwater metagenome TaxID=717931 RepID=A0A098E8T2_9ZZZZ
MASEKGLIVLATFFIVMSLTTNIGFAKDGAVIELYAATVLNILATFVKVGMKKGVLAMTSLGASVVGDIHLIAAVVVLGSDPALAAGLAFGAIFANVVSIALMLMESYLEAKKEDYSA